MIEPKINRPKRLDLKDKVNNDICFKNYRLDNSSIWNIFLWSAYENDINTIFAKNNMKITDNIN